MIFRYSQVPRLPIKRKFKVMQSPVTNVVIEWDIMRFYNLYLLLSLVIIFLFISITSGYQISDESTNNVHLKSNYFIRIKRQLEDLENDEYPSPSTQQAQEESGFWDRVVKVALRLFNKFIEWLNTS